MLMQRIVSSVPLNPVEVRKSVRAAMSKRELGYRQFQVKEFIERRAEIDGQTPSFDMICAEFGMDRGNLSRLIAALARRGFVSLSGYDNECQFGRPKSRRISLI